MAKITPPPDAAGCSPPSRAAALFPWFTRQFQRVRRVRKRTVAGAVVVFHVLGAISSVHAVMATRTSQGAIAWAVSLNAFPYIAVPSYWVFGRNSFEGYVVARRAELAKAKPVEDTLVGKLDRDDLRATVDDPSTALFAKLADLPFTRANDAELLVDGEATFASIFEAIDAAEHDILVQFYIIHDDELGRELATRLAAKARRGVKVYVLYDEIGSHSLPDTYAEWLRDAGAEVTPFNSTQGPRNRFQVNFRNHRKIVCVDGKVAFVGGHNVGDEYLGKNPELSPWRDTHVKAQGPVVQCVQVSFAEDWHWATGELLTELNWDPDPSPDGGDVAALCLPTGPADPVETCTFFFLTAINHASDRLWIASPYFVPDPQVLSALQLAAMRGVDVRILIPEKSDSTLTQFSSYAHLPEMEAAGVKVLRFTNGFLHQKVVLVDDHLAAVGTANLDNRSFRLNFEVTLLVDDVRFAADVAAMLENDFAHSVPAPGSESTDRPFLQRLATRVAYLFAPVQ